MTSPMEKPRNSRPKRRRKLLKRLMPRHHAPGTSPGKLRSMPEAQETRVRVLAYGPDGLLEKDIHSVDDLRPLPGQWPVLWVHVEGLADLKILEEIGALFTLHPLLLEDIVSFHQRPKVEAYQDALFMVSRLAHVKPEGELELEQISLVLHGNTVLTFQEHHGTAFEPVRERIRTMAGGRIRLSQADYLVYAILDLIIDSFFPVLDHCNDLLDAFEDRVVMHPDREMIDQIHNLKNDLLALRRVIWPQREAVSTLSRDTTLIQASTHIFLRDCYDHVVQVMDILESHRERASDLINIYLSSVSNRMNEIMKVLTLFATIFMPLSFIAGVYGMNFRRESSPLNMPELDWYFGYPLVLGLMVAVAGGLLAFFKRKGWW